MNVPSREGGEYKEVMNCRLFWMVVRDKQVKVIVGDVVETDHKVRFFGVGRPVG